MVRGAYREEARDDEKVHRALQQLRAAIYGSDVQGDWQTGE